MNALTLCYFLSLSSETFLQNFTESAVSVSLLGASSVDRRAKRKVPHRRAERRSAPLTAEPVMAEFGGMVQGKTSLECDDTTCW